MTECERIIKEGILPETFFKPETICDFYVDEMRKKIWAIEIDLYLELEKVCKKHNLRFYAIGGSILGAVRHNGFIPWDDDMDVCMPREDYEKLCNICMNDFEPPYFLQTPKTDPGYYISFAKLRNSNTTCISMPFRNALFNQGVGIDIFPLDTIDINKAKETMFKINESIMKCSSYMKIGSEEYLTDRQMANFKKYRTNNPMEEYYNIQDLAQSFGNTEYLGLNVCTVYSYKRLSWPKKCFEKTLLHKFENIQITLPQGWHEIMNICFGDYMKFPKVEERGNWHSNVFWNLDVPYSNYLLPNRGGWNIVYRI